LKIRLAEIDAPEKGHAFGNRSKQCLSEVCFKKQAESRPQTTDRCDRTVAPWERRAGRNGKSTTRNL
jgi:micrococcal nuclease